MPLTIKIGLQLKTESIVHAVTLARKLGHLFVTTADGKGLPHVAAAAEMNSVAENRVAVSAWFCPGTLANLDQNRLVSLVVWDEDADSGLQLLGRVENIKEKAMMDGYLPETEGLSPMPQIERILEVTVNRVIEFSHAPHSDVDE
jgi:hypothetical protein